MVFFCAFTAAEQGVQWFTAMTDIRILPVSGSRDMKQFVTLPARLYRGTPWVPPIWADERRGYSAESNPVLENSDFTLLLAWRDGAPAGRILAYVDRSWNEHFSADDGLFGALDAVDDPAVYRALLDAAAAFLAARGARRMLGPIHPVAEFWGTLVRGFDTPPVFLTPWNPPAADGLIREAGFDKEMDLLAYQADVPGGYRLPDRYRDFYRRFLARRPAFTLRSLDMSRFLEDAGHIWRITDLSLINNWGYVPVPRDVFLDMVRRLKLIVDPEAICFVEKDGVPVGYALGYPDINIILKAIRGRLFPLGWLILLHRRRRLKHYRLFGLGVLREFHGMGLDALMYVHLAKSMERRGIRLEANWILENNLPMNNALVRLGLKVIKRYRLYSRVIA
jgi:ribosomal protein S18 acetylase RimI-like enzyme